MNISYEELMNIKMMQKAELVAGSSGTWRRITGAHVVEVVDAHQWVKEGELLFISGVGLKNKEKDLLIIVNTIAKKNAAGLVIEIGPFIQDVSEELMERANELGLPVFTVPFSVSVGEIISKIFYLLYNQDNHQKSLEDLMEEMVYGEDDANYDKLLYRGFNEKIRHAAVYIGVDKAAKIMDEQLKKTFLNAVKQQFGYQTPLLYLRDDNQIAVIIDFDNSHSEKQLKALIDEIITGINGRISATKKTVSIGVGKSFNSVREIKKSVIESKKAYKILRSCGVISGARYYEEIGIYQMFFEHNENELREYVDETLGGLIQYDRSNDSELADTLRVYLESDCNMSEVTEKIFVHRNTVKYRIKRIEEILGYGLANVNRQFNLRLAYKIIKYLG